MGIRDISAQGHMVKITDDAGIELLIDRTEALWRANAIKGMDKSSEDLRSALIKAVKQAYFNDTGKHYSSQDLLALLTVINKTGSAN